LIKDLQTGLKRMHNGGLNSNEQTRIVKTGEFILRDQSVRSIGAANLSQMNKTGQMPAPATTVVNNYRTFINANDALSFDAYIRANGSRAIHDISLNSIAVARRRGDRRVVGGR